MEKFCFNCFNPCTGAFCGHCGYEQGSSMKKYPLALPEGSVLAGRYIVGRVLGQGGFGITYAAQDVTTGEKVAIKEFFPSAVVTRTETISVSLISVDESEFFNYGKDSFLKEAKTLAEFNNHPNIVHVYSYFEENNTAYLAMEFLDGENLLDYLKRVGRISWEDTKKLALPVMNALEFVHSKGIIHRDISPDNIFLCSDGSVRLIDFGAARYSLGDRSHSLSVVLKHGYAPHEQYTRRGRQGAYTDVYALAATMYRAVTGQVPPEAPDRMYEDAIVLPSSLGADIPSRDEKALLKALAFNYTDRFQTVTEFRQALTGVKPHPPVSRPSYPVNGPMDYRGVRDADGFAPRSNSYADRKKKGKGKIIAIVACVAAAVAGIAIALIFIFSRTGTSTPEKSPAEMIKGNWTSVTSSSDTIKIDDSKMYLQMFSATETADYEIMSDNSMSITDEADSDVALMFSEVSDESSLAGGSTTLSTLEWYVSDDYLVIFGIVFKRD